MVLLYFLHTLRCAHIFGVALETNVNCDLEVVLFLAHKCFIRHRKVEAFISIHTICWARSGEIKSHTAKHSKTNKQQQQN